MIWRELHFAMDHPPHVKAGDFSGTYISECGDFMISPNGEEGMFNLLGATQTGMVKMNYQVLTGKLEHLKIIDIQKTLQQ